MSLGCKEFGKRLKFHALKAFDSRDTMDMQQADSKQSHRKLA